MKRHTAFTLLELIFVIIILGIIGKFGVEFLAQAYKGFIFSSINNQLQSNSEAAVEAIAARLQYRIKDSVIARTDVNASPLALANASGTSYKVLEWVGTDMDGFRGISDDNTTVHLPNWSGIINLDAGDKDTLISPQTNTVDVNQTISDLSNGDSNIGDAALYFIGSNTDVVSGYGWSGALTNQQGAMHPITSVAGDATAFTSSNGVDFSGIDVYEYYQLAWSAYAIVFEPSGTLRLYYDYQPWNGDTLNDGKSAILMENVSTFQFMSIDSIMKIQVCTKSDLVTAEGYSLCKEKTVF